MAHSTLNVEFSKINDLGDTFWVLEICFTFLELAPRII